MDVYAYAITCVEVLNMGQMPWNLIDDNAVQFIVLSAFLLICPIGVI